MITTELLLELTKLTRAEKLRVIKVLTEELSKDDDVTEGEQDTAQSWSAYDTQEAAAILLQLIEDEQDSDPQTKPS